MNHGTFEFDVQAVVAECLHFRARPVVTYADDWDRSTLDHISQLHHSPYVS